ncbi:MAG TPA: hypothetical protein VN673_11415, partial [Clostridia bacterium]|nr:hypothetical protein [Clostridia bacterium]
HPSGLVFLAPNGKVAGYQFGVAYRGSELLTSLKQTRSGQPGSPVRKLVLLCFHYNPISGKYGPAIMAGVRLLGLITLVALGGTIWRAARRRKNPGRAAAKEVPS